MSVPTTRGQKKLFARVSYKINVTTWDNGGFMHAKRASNYFQIDYSIPMNLTQLFDFRIK